MKGKTRSERLPLITICEMSKVSMELSRNKKKHPNFQKREREYANYKHVVFSAWHLLVNTYSKSNLFNAQNIFSMNTSQKFQGVNHPDTLNYTTHPITHPAVCSLCCQWMAGGEGWSPAEVHAALLYAWGTCMCRFPHL